MQFSLQVPCCVSYDVDETSSSRGRKRTSVRAFYGSCHEQTCWEVASWQADTRNDTTKFGEGNLTVRRQGPRC